MVLEFEPVHPLAGPIVTDGISAELWHIKANIAANFHTREANLSEYLNANFQHAVAEWRAVAIVAAVGCINALIYMLVFRRNLGWALRLIFFVMGHAIILPLFAFGFMFFFYGTVSATVWISALAFGVGCAVLGRIASAFLNGRTIIAR